MIMKRVGDIVLENVVIIADPSYLDEECCSLYVPCKSGTYSGYVGIEDNISRIGCLVIYKDDEEIDLVECEYIGVIGVDTALAGFFNEKAQFTKDELASIPHDLNGYCVKNGIVSMSGYGDGVYKVYSNKERSWFKIEFCDEDEEVMI